MRSSFLITFCIPPLPVPCLTAIRVGISTSLWAANFESSDNVLIAPTTFRSPFLKFPAFTLHSITLSAFRSHVNMLLRIFVVVVYNPWSILVSFWEHPTELIKVVMSHFVLW